MDIVLYIIIPITLLSIGYLFIATRRIRKQNQVITHQANEISKKTEDIEKHIEGLDRLKYEKSQILSIVSHDLKSPLNRVFALTNLLNLEKEGLNENQLEYIHKIQTSVTDGLQLIRNLLDVRAIEDKGIELSIKPLKAGSLLASITKSYLAAAEKKDIKLSFKDHSDNISIESDQQYFERIFDNVISNAVKFTKLGGQVTVKLEDTGKTLTGSVSDEGPGILEEEKDLVFKKFEVLSSKPTGGESSHGLGLLITKSLCEKLGGSVWFDTEVEKGSTFYIKMHKEIPTEVYD